MDFRNFVLVYNDLVPKCGRTTGRGFFSTAGTFSLMIWVPFKKNLNNFNTFSSAYTHFDSFLSSTNKIGIIHTLVNRCIGLCSTCSMLSVQYSQLTLLKKNFQKNVYLKNFTDWGSMLLLNRTHIYLKNFTDRGSMLFLNRTHILKEKVPRVEKKPLGLVLPYFRIAN